MWIIKDQDNDRLRPLMDVEDAADKIELMMNGTYPDVEGAHEWIQQYDWANIANQWGELFEEAIAAPVIRYRPKQKMAVPSKKKRR